MEEDEDAPARGPVVFRDPRAKAAGGRTPHKEPLSDPYQVIKARGNRATLSRNKAGKREEIDARLEDIIQVPQAARLLEWEPLEFELQEDTTNIRMAGEASET